MTSQLLFGEMFSILDRATGWLFIRNDYDGYEGWIGLTGTYLLNDGEYDHYGNMAQCFQPGGFLRLQKKAGEEPMMIPAGSVLYFEKDQPLKVYCVDSYRIEKPCRQPGDTSPESIINTGRKFLHIPYLWGGKSTFGTDCSGLVQTIFRIHGIRIPRDTSLQVQEGSAVNILAEALTGDLLFFDNEEGEIVHVGMLLEEGYILHASGMVRIDPVDHQGIYSRDLKRYTHKLRVIKRILQ